MANFRVVEKFFRLYGRNRREKTIIEEEFLVIIDLTRPL